MTFKKSLSKGKANQTREALASQISQHLRVGYEEYSFDKPEKKSTRICPSSVSVMHIQQGTDSTQRIQARLLITINEFNPFPA